MLLSFNSRIEVPVDVLVSELDGESVLMNLKTDAHVGLDEVGTAIWSVVRRSDSIEDAYRTLTLEWNTDETVLRSNLTSLLQQLVTAGLIRIDP
jgi:hypothetical protein